MGDDLMAGLPGDLPTFQARFGTDAQVPRLSVPGALARGLLLCAAAATVARTTTRRG